MPKNINFHFSSFLVLFSFEQFKIKTAKTTYMHFEIS